MAPSNYILFSDVHLGADLVDHVRPWAREKLREIARVDRELVAMLAWYREHRDPDRPWTLVIAGDLVDFIGIAIAPQEVPASELSDEERAHGLGGRAHHAVLKMRAVAERHRSVFAALAAFLQDGHSLVLVRGNHDLDFHWQPARDAFVDAVLAHLADLDGAAVDALRARIEFHPWFYYVEGLLYVEHGHQYDAMCSYHHLLAPVSPDDPARLCWSFGDILLRRVVRPTPGLGIEGHEHRGIVDYVRFGLSLGLGGGLRLFARYADATREALRRTRAHMGARAEALRAEHHRGLQQLSERTRLGIEKLTALTALWPGPVTRGVLPVLRSMFMDRMLLALALCVAVLLSLLAFPQVVWLPLAGLFAAATAGFWLWSERTRRRDLDASVHMHLAAAHIAKLLPSRYVVMGHTHAPLTRAAGESVTYVNLGHWGSDDEAWDAGADRDPPRSHLVLRWQNGEPVARFLRWVPGRGPEPLSLAPGGAPERPVSAAAGAAFEGPVGSAAAGPNEGPSVRAK